MLEVFFMQREEILKHLIINKQFNFINLETIQKEPVQLIKIGALNRNQGPDFSNSIIIWNNIKWFGNIEVHLYSSDWYKHGHHTDPKYNNVILHISLYHDKDIYNLNGIKIPSIELKNRIQHETIEQFQKFMNQENVIKCKNTLHSISPIHMFMQIERCAIERFERKVKNYEIELEKLNYNWDKLLYESMAKYIGSPVNKENMSYLTKGININLLRKNNFAPFLLQCSTLKNQETNYLEYKYQLKNKLSPISWNYSKMYPSSFPEKRIHQLNEIWKSSPYLFQSLLSSKDIHQLLKAKGLGESSINRMLINAILPIISLYLKLHKGSLYQYFIEKISQLKAEDNRIIRRWKKLGIEAKNALDSQGLIELHEMYCKNGQCFNCKVGNQILRK